MAAEAPSFSKFEEKKKQHSDKRKQTVRSIFKKSGTSTFTMPVVRHAERQQINFNNDIVRESMFSK